MRACFVVWWWDILFFSTLSIRCFFFFFSSRRRHTRCSRDWSSDVCSSDLNRALRELFLHRLRASRLGHLGQRLLCLPPMDVTRRVRVLRWDRGCQPVLNLGQDRKSVV